jgi:hypothetical protein
MSSDDVTVLVLLEGTEGTDKPFPEIPAFQEFQALPSG